MNIETGEIYNTLEDEYSFLILDNINDSEVKVIRLFNQKKNLNDIKILETDMKNLSAKLESVFYANVESVYSVETNILKTKIADLKDLKFDKILRVIVKYTSNLYYKKAKSRISKNKSLNNYISPSGKILDEKELSNMIDASLDMWLTTGRFNDSFEKKLAEFLGVKYVLSTNSGSSANLLALTSLTSNKLGERQLKEGDEVITVAAGFPTTISPIIMNNLIPVFIDIELETYNIDTEQIEACITSKTKVIMVAHTLGNPYKLEKIVDLCEKYNLWLIEDNCDALGSKYNNQYTGTFGDISTLSFYPAHHITMGEGGAVLTNNELLSKIIMSYRDWGRDCWCKTGVSNTCGSRFDLQFGQMPSGYDHKYIYSHLGYNLKITDWQASIALAQLDKLPFFIEKRAYNFDFLKEKLSKYKEYLLLPQVTSNATPSWFGFLITIKENDKFTKNDLVVYLEKNNIGTRQLFAGNILKQPMFLDNEFKIKIKDSELLFSNNVNKKYGDLLPNTDFVMNNTFWIGVWPGITQENLDYMIEKFDSFFMSL